MKNTKLEQYLEMRKMSFFSTTEKMTESERNDYQVYDNLRDEIAEDAKQLRKGDKVQFVWNEKISNKGGRGGLPTFKSILMEGVVEVPVKLKKRTILGEDCSIDVIKIVSGKYIYPVSPSSVCKI